MLEMVLVLPRQLRRGLARDQAALLQLDPARRGYLFLADVVYGSYPEDRPNDGRLLEHHPVLLIQLLEARLEHPLYCTRHAQSKRLVWVDRPG